MSQLVQDFNTKLVAAIPSATVRPVVNKSNDLPSATYDVRGGVRTAFYKGSFGLRRTTITVSLYSRSYGELQTLKTAVIDEFHGFSGTMGATEILKCEVGVPFENFQGGTEELYRAIIPIEFLD